MSARRVLDRLRRPEYTGENRCIPCTVVNSVIAVVLAGATQLGVVATGGGAVVALAASAAVLGVAAAAIALRGYLVPGTPWLTRTYFPPWLLARFDKAPEPGATPPQADADVDVESTLVGLGALAPCDDEDDLCLTEDFRTAWRSAVADARAADARADLARILGVDPDDLAVTEVGDAFEARVEGRRVGQWESRAAVLADVAAAEVLRERAPDWETRRIRERGRLLHGLRLFLERCPTCDGSVALGQGVVESCCRSVDVVTVTCVDCDARLFEIEHGGGA